MKLTPDDLFKATKEGVDSAFWAWLIEHEVTAPEHFEDGVKEAVTDWLNVHGERLVTDTVRSTVREWLADLNPTSVHLTDQEENQ